MDGFSVTPSAVAAAGASAAVAAGGIEDVRVAGAIERLAAVLPGSVTAAATRALMARWDDAQQALAREMTAHAGRLADSASSYDSTDTWVAAGLRAR